MNPSSIQKLIDLFSKFPTIGRRTASRFVFYLIRSSDEEFNDLIKSLKELRENISVCAFCFNPFEISPSEKKFCEICINALRDKNTLCLVEKESDLRAIENTKKYNGIYFVLGGTISSPKEEEIKKIRIKELEERVKKLKNLKEIIIATNFTPEGESTAFYIERRLNDINPSIKITRLGRGLPVGGELEYADEETLENALQGRK
jgi:recombination protein RecR